MGAFRIRHYSKRPSNWSVRGGPHPALLWSESLKHAGRARQYQSSARLSVLLEMRDSVEFVCTASAHHGWSNTISGVHRLRLFRAPARCRKPGTGGARYRQPSDPVRRRGTNLARILKAPRAIRRDQLIAIQPVARHHPVVWRRRSPENSGARQSTPRSPTPGEASRVAV